jgi:hypothetical protein
MTCAALATLVTSGVELRTEYKAGVARKLSIESTMRMETTVSESERDGEKQPSRAGMKTETHREEVHVDQVLEAEDGKPTRVRRHFVELGGTVAMEGGETSRESEVESPWGGVTLELAATKDGVEAEVVDGTEPDGEGVLEGHVLELFLDGLMPGESVDADASWELDSKAIARALRIDVQRKLYPPPARPEGEGGGGGGRRGGRSGVGDPGLSESEWKGTGKLAGSEEKQGVECAVVELELETSGERTFEGFGGGRGRMLALPAENKTSWSTKLKGKLWFDAKAKRPVALELEGAVKQETRMEFEGEGRSMKSWSVREGSMEMSVEIEDAPAEEIKPKK